MPDATTINEQIQQGKLTAAVDAAIEWVKASPSDAAARGVLFETLCFAGEYDRAQKHLNVLAGGSDSLRLQLYHNAMKAETARTQVFTEGRVPDVIAQPDDSFTARMDALIELREGRADAAADRLKDVLQAEPNPGRSPDGPFTHFSDADDVLGPFVEFLGTDGRYFWIDSRAVRTIEPTPIRTWIDTLWRPVVVTPKGAPPLTGSIPVIYFGTGSQAEDDDSYRLGYQTRFDDVGGLNRGVGQRLFLLDDAEVPALQLGNLAFEDVGDSDESGGGGDSEDSDAPTAAGSVADAAASDGEAS